MTALHYKIDPEFTHLYPEGLKYAKEGDAGFDLRAVREVKYYYGQQLALQTGISMEIPYGYVGLVTPRSGLALKHGLSITNSPGIIDAGYRGEILVILTSQENSIFRTERGESLTILAGDRIAQMVIVPFLIVDFHQIDTLASSERGMSGLGSTGK